MKIIIKLFAIISVVVSLTALADYTPSWDDAFPLIKTHSANATNDCDECGCYPFCF